MLLWFKQKTKKTSIRELWAITFLKWFLAKSLVALILFQLAFSSAFFWGLSPDVWAADPNIPVINNLNDGWVIDDNTPTFNFDISDPDVGDTIHYEVEIDEAGGDFSTPVTALTEAWTDFMMIAGGLSYSLALAKDGTVWAWGRNSYGQLGDGTTTTSSLPVQVKGSAGTGTLSGITAIAANYMQSFALAEDGTVWAWGRNNYGQLGDGTITNSSLPVQVKNSAGTGVLSGITAIIAGGHHTLALAEDGTVWAWGRNQLGQLGDWTMIDSLLPVQVKDITGMGTLSGITSIMASDYHSLALANDGTVWAWGTNGSGQLGDGTMTNRSLPVQVKDMVGTGILTGVTALSGGYAYSFALADDGTVWAWGKNSPAPGSLGGQLGDGTTTDRYLPVQVKDTAGMGVLSGITSITGGTYHSLAITDNGTIWSWGNNSSGELGDGTIISRSLPVQVKDEAGTGTLSKISMVATSSMLFGPGTQINHSLALADDGTILAWGNNGYGQLGDETTTNSSLPLQLGEVLGRATPRTGVEFTSPPLADGKYIWRVRTVDQDDNTSDWTTANTGFSIDSNDFTLPTSKILYPQKEAKLKDVDRIVGKSTDGNGVNFTRISIQNTSTGKYYNGTGFLDTTETWLNTTAISDNFATTRWYFDTSGIWTDFQNYAIRSRATDLAGNEEHTDSITFTYDTVDGAEGSVYISNPAVNNNSDYKIYYPNTDAVPANGYIEIDFDDSFWFSSWMESADISLTDEWAGIIATSDVIDRVNKKITTTIISGNVGASDMLELQINNLRIHNPSTAGSYYLPIRLYNDSDVLLESGTGEIILVQPYQQVEVNIAVQQSLQLSVDSGSVVLEVDPDVQGGQNWNGTGGIATEKTDVTVRTNSQAWYNLFVSLAGNTATWTAVLDGETNTGSQIGSSGGDRVTTENNFSFATNSGSNVTGTAFLPDPTEVSNAWLNTSTNQNTDSIYYYLNVDYLTPSDTYKGTVTYTAVGEL